MSKLMEFYRGMKPDTCYWEQSGWDRCVESGCQHQMSGDVFMELGILAVA